MAMSRGKVPRMDDREPQDLVLSTYVSESLKNELVELAARNDRSIAAEIRLALRKHLDAAKEAV